MPPLKFLPTNHGYSVKQVCTIVDTGEFPFSSHEMRLPPHWGASMIWHDVIKMEIILFRPPLANFYIAMCVWV